LIKLPHIWTPRPYQERLWNFLCEGGRYAVVCWHRRAGKDDICLHHTACAAHERVGNYWHMLPMYAQARKAIWDAVNPHTGMKRIDEAFPEELREATNDQEMKIKFKNGSTWQVVGSDNVNSLVGAATAGMVFSEYALSNPSSWGYLAPILEENKGWAIFISTPRGKNHFEAMMKMARKNPEWFTEVLPVTETGVFSQDFLDQELQRLQDLHGDQYGRSIWLQEYFCSFDAAIPGAIWGDCLERAEREGRITDVPPLPGAVVDTGWDLGRTDDTAIWFRQFSGRDLHLIHHHASNGKDVQFYVDYLLAVRLELKVEYGTHWLPHDARPRTLAAGGKSILQQFQDAARLNPELGRFAIIPRLDVIEGIQAARKTFPQCRFDKTRCAKGLESLRNYHRKWDDEKKMFLDNPEHDWSSHDADAFRYLSLSWRFSKPKQELDMSPEAVTERLLKNNPVGFTFGQMKEKHFAKRRQMREWSTV
jgi:phage terminase large subunit